MAKNPYSITLGVGDLSVNGADVGYLAGAVTFSCACEVADVKAGIPERLVKRVITGQDATLKASLAQIDTATLALALGTSTPQTALGLGLGDGSVITLTNVVFTHRRDDGSAIVITIPKAVVNPGLGLTFSGEEFTAQDIVLNALWDGSSAIATIATET